RARGVRGRDEEVRVAEEGEGRGSTRIAVHHVQRLLPYRVSKGNGYRRWGRGADVRINRRRGSRIALELSHRGVGPAGLTVDVDGWRRIEVDAVCRLPGGQDRVQVQRDLTNLIRWAGLTRRHIAEGVAVRERTIGLRGAGAAGKVVAFISGDREQRVVLRDAIGGQPLEELLEGIVIGRELCLVVRLAWTRRAGKRVIVVRVGDVGVRHRNAGFLHLRDIAQRVGGQRTVETGEARLPERVGDRLSVHVIDRGASVVDRGVDVLGAEETLVADVAIWFVGKFVGPGIGGIRRVGGADAAAIGAVNRDPDEVGLRLRAGRRPRGAAREAQ